MSRPVLPLEPDPVIEFFKAQVDRLEIRRNLKLSVDERLQKMSEHMQVAKEIESAIGRKHYFQTTSEIRKFVMSHPGLQFLAAKLQHWEY